MSKISSYDAASDLASDLAEVYLANKVSECFISDGEVKAKQVRVMSESNVNQTSCIVQDYRRDRLVIRSAILELMDGYNG